VQTSLLDGRTLDGPVLGRPDPTWGDWGYEQAITAFGRAAKNSDATSGRARR